jgi:polyhydroxyalkanoate synthesis regulator phasin
MAIRLRSACAPLEPRGSAACVDDEQSYTYRRAWVLTTRSTLFMADKPHIPDAKSSADPAASTTNSSTPVAPKRSPGHRGADVRDTVAEMAAKAQEISQEAGSKMAAAMRDVISAAAGMSTFAADSARDLVQYMVRRGQMTQEEADKLIREAEEAAVKRNVNLPPPPSKVPKPPPPPVAVVSAPVAPPPAPAVVHHPAPVVVKPVPQHPPAVAKHPAPVKKAAAPAPAKHAPPRPVAKKAAPAKAVAKKKPAKKR